MRRHNPMRVPDSHLPKGLTLLSSSKTEAILPIIHKVVFLPAHSLLDPNGNARWKVLILLSVNGHV
jgi:hypothetical protein